MEWPEREAHGYLGDVGIDLVAEQTEAWGGGLCAFQTKFFAESQKIAKGDVDTFLSASSAAIFSNRILVVTSELSTHAQTMVSKTSPRCEVVSRAEIESWPVDWSEFLDTPERLAFEPVRYDPHPYQSEAVQKVVSGFADNDRGKLVLPCGTGKSVVSLWIAEHVAGVGGRVLYLVPSIALMGQTMREWARQADPEPVTEVIAPARRDGVELLDCEIRHVDGSRNALNRANTIAWLQQGSPDECRIVTNAKCLTEGVDVPALDAVLFLEPKRSQVDVVQAVGRVMRRSENKECGYVVLPVVVPDGATLADDSVLSGSDFKQVWNVLKALRSHDDRLDVAVNTADLTGKLPVTILTSGVCEKCGRAGCDGGDECPERHRFREQVQGTLPFENAIASKLVDICGDRQYWDRWGKEVAKITNTITARVRTVIANNDELAARFDQFTEQMETTTGGSLPSGDLAVMVAQHVVTMPVFDALFAGSDFADRNPISKALNELLGEFKDHDVRLADETINLDRFYAYVRVRLEGAPSSDARIKIMLEVYESFFAEAMPREVQSLGNVHGPC